MAQHPPQDNLMKQAEEVSALISYVNNHDLVDAK